jgi:hypothetical protein
MIMALTPEQQAEMRQKVAALDIFRGKKPWRYCNITSRILIIISCARKFDADYLEMPSNPNQQKYVAAMAKLFSTYGKNICNLLLVFII